MTLKNRLKRLESVTDPRVYVGWAEDYRKEGLMYRDGAYWRPNGIPSDEKVTHIIVERVGVL